jgi:hypothetical protein
MRLGVPSLREGTGGDTLRLTARLETTVGAIEGVNSISINIVTGSMLVEHDGAPARERSIFAVLYAVLPPATPKPPRFLNDLWRFAAVVDQRVLRASDGWIDLKTAVPVVLGAYGLARMLTERPLRPPSGLAMMWWAYVALQRLACEESLGYGRTDPDTGLR